MAKLTLEYAISHLVGNPHVDRVAPEPDGSITVWAKEGCGWKTGSGIRPATQFLPGTRAKHFHLGLDGLARFFDAPLETIAEVAVDVVEDVIEDAIDNDPTYQEDCAGDAEHERRSEEGE